MTPALYELRSAGRIALPASGKTTRASTPFATMPWMSEIAFCVLPCPSAYVSEVTFGHFFASSRADAVVTRRQLLPPKPSVKPSVIFFEPHHDGTADVLADEVVAVSMTTLLMSAKARSAPRLRLVIVRCPSFRLGGLPGPRQIGLIR